MAIGDKSKRRRTQITDRLVIALTITDNAWASTRELTGMLLDNNTLADAENKRLRDRQTTAALHSSPVSRSKPRHVTMRYLPTSLQLAQFMRMDERFEQRQAGKSKEYRLLEVTA
tara:strand:+ start:829 stop:1173 length:345 start_codon:yes stop_codon:yes gene_type:complete